MSNPSSASKKSFNEDLSSIPIKKKQVKNIQEMLLENIDSLNDLTIEIKSESKDQQESREIEKTNPIAPFSGESQTRITLPEPSPSHYIESLKELDTYQTKKQMKQFLD